MLTGLAVRSRASKPFGTNVMPHTSELATNPHLVQAVTAAESRIGQLTLIAGVHAAAGRPAHARCARMLVALLQDELASLNAGRRPNRN